MIDLKISIALSILLILFSISCKPKHQEAIDNTKLPDNAVLLKQGDTITSRVRTLLLANVMTAIKSGGPVKAVSFCNVHAIPLTDSLGGEYNCIIQRVSEKYRNPANIASTRDLEIVKKSGSENLMKPVLVNENGRMVYYKSIKIAMPACLKCHGTIGKEIDAKTKEIIRQKYPDDLATGYKEGDLRGLWKITFLGE